MNADIKSVLSDDCTLDSYLEATEAALSANPSITEKQRREWMGHYKWTANVVAKALKVRRSGLTVEEMMKGEEKITKYISRQPISNSAKVMLRCYRKRMIKHAKELGWSPNTFALEDEWQPAKDAAKGVPAALSIILWAIERNLSMNEFSDASLEEWGSAQKLKGCTYRYIISRKSAFRGAMRDAGLQGVFPLLSTAIAATFRIGARDLPEWLRSHIAAIIWNMRSEARMDGRRFPITSARGLVVRFREVFGYASLNPDMSIASMEELLAEPLIRDYVLFLHCKKKWKRASIVSSIGRIHNALRVHPTLSNQDFSYMKSCILELPEDDDTDIDPAADGREILLDDLAKIPKKICAARNRLKHRHPRAEAWLVLKEFVIFFLVTHPWPSQCLTTCRIHGSKRNLFKGPRPRDHAPFAWLSHHEQKSAPNSEREFWQFDFSPEQVQLGRYARGPLLSPLVRKLTQYLHHRKELVKGRTDPGTLLVNFAGNPFESGEFAKLVADTCAEYCGVRVSPSAFRQKFLFDWLTEYPGDVPDVAAILWINQHSAIVAFERRGANCELTSSSGERRRVRQCRSYWR